jgi:putative oxidoreductase
VATFLQVVRDIALFLARIGLGGILILHGWRRWQGVGVSSQISYLEQFATPFPHYAAWGGTMFELIGGVFLIVGALTPLVAAIAVAEQVLIIAWTSWYKGFYLTNQSGAFRGGYEYSVALGLLALLFVVFGAGQASVDRLFRRSPRHDEIEPDTEPAAPLANRRVSGSTPSGQTAASRPDTTTGPTAASRPDTTTGPTAASGPTTPSNPETPAGDNGERGETQQQEETRQP